MTRVLFLFLDGVGLGERDPERNPFAAAELPALRALLDGRGLVAESAPYHNDRASLLAVDACLGVPRSPQSASGQAALLTGRNVPREIGEHYGPKPNPAIAAILNEDNLFMEIVRRGGTAALLNAYPPVYFHGIDSGRRLFSAIPLALSAAGLPLMTSEDLQAGRALAVDFTGEGWAAQPGFPPAPIYSPEQAGAQLAALSQSYDLSWFDFWPSDIAGHKRDMARAVHLLQGFDAVFASLIDAWRGRDNLIVITSDHGNLEDLSVRSHTRNPVPALIVGPNEPRRRFASGLRDLTHFAPAVLQALFPDAKLI